MLSKLFCFKSTQSILNLQDHQSDLLPFKSGTTFAFTFPTQLFGLSSRVVPLPSTNLFKFVPLLDILWPRSTTSRNSMPLEICWVIIFFPFVFGLSYYLLYRITVETYFGMILMIFFKNKKMVCVYNCGSIGVLLEFRKNFWYANWHVFLNFDLKYFSFTYYFFIEIGWLFEKHCFTYM